MNEAKKSIIETTNVLRQQVKKYIEKHGTSDDMDDIEMGVDWILKKLAQGRKAGSDFNAISASS
jgi:hypothetical protein